MNKRISVVSILIVTCIAIVVAFGAVMVSQNMKTTAAPTTVVQTSPAATVTADPTVATVVADLDNAQGAVNAAVADATNGDVNGTVDEATSANNCFSAATGVLSTAEPSQQLRLAAHYGIDVGKEIEALDKAEAAIMSNDGQAAATDGQTVGTYQVAAAQDRAAYEDYVSGL